LATSYPSRPAGRLSQRRAIHVLAEHLYRKNFRRYIDCAQLRDSPLNTINKKFTHHGNETRGIYAGCAILSIGAVTFARNRHCWHAILASSFYEQRQAALMVQSLLPIKPKDHRKESALHRENIKTPSIRGYSMNTMNKKMTASWSILKRLENVPVARFYR
jgi:hypothetical protein